MSYQIVSDVGHCVIIRKLPK